MRKLERAAVAAVIGAAAMYFFDPERGWARRARVRTWATAPGRGPAACQQVPNESLTTPTQGGQPLSQPGTEPTSTTTSYGPVDQPGDRSTRGAEVAARDPRAGTPESGDRGPARRYSDAEWRAMVSRAAYFRAERRAFAGGTPRQDWLAAEEELRRTLRDGGKPSPSG